MPSAATWSPIPAVNSVKPMSGPSRGLARPASATRYSSSSPPSRSSTVPTALSTAFRCASPRTSAATASVTARHAVRQRSSQCVIAESARRLLDEQLRARRSESSERRAVHHGAVPGRDLRPSFRHVSLRRIRDSVPDAPEHASREAPDIRRIGGQPVQVPPQHVVRVQPAALRERSAEVARHRGVVGPLTGSESHPALLERRQRIGDLARA